MIPTYNCAHYLRETLASVLVQDQGPECMQIEVVDDHSTRDDPAAVVEEMGRGRVSFYRQSENVGYIRNFETCLKRSRGKLIHLLHGDDYVRAGFYGKMERAFVEHSEIGAAFCRQVYMDEAGHWQSISRLEQSESGILNNWLERIVVHHPIQTPSIVVRRDVYEHLGGFDCRLTCTGEDWEMWVRIAIHYPVGYEVEPLAVYRLTHAGSLTGGSVRSGKYARDLRKAGEIVSSYLPAHIPQAVATSLLRQSREAGAPGIISLAEQMLKIGDKAAAITQIREALKSTHSLRVLKQITRLILKAGARWLRKTTSTSVRISREFFRSIMEHNIRPLILQTSIRHISGRKKLHYGIDELIVLCVVRNGELYVKSFIEYYFSLGVKHIVFLDNGSTDDTIDLVCNCENVTIIQTQLPYKKYENIMKRYLVKKFSRNRWNIFSDIDELFDYPFSDVLSLRSLLIYLNENSYTAVVAQMLDLFSDIDMASLKSRKHDSIREKYIYYDISNIQKKTYSYGTLSNQEIKHYFGGIRQSLFGTHNGLTKAPLIFVDDQISTFVHCHHVRNACIADFTGVLLHYPFTSSFYEKVQDAVQTGRYEQSANHEYAMYWQRLKQDPSLHIRQETACKLENVNCLIGNGFLVASENFLQWVKMHSKT